MLWIEPRGKTTLQASQCIAERVIVKTPSLKHCWVQSVFLFEADQSVVVNMKPVRVVMHVLQKHAQDRQEHLERSKGKPSQIYNSVWRCARYRKLHISELIRIRGKSAKKCNVAEDQFPHNFSVYVICFCANSTPKPDVQG